MSASAGPSSTTSSRKNKRPAEAPENTPSASCGLASEKQSQLANVRLYDLANAGNHLHLIIKVPSPRAYRRFIRSVSGLVARKVMGVQRGHSLKDAGLRAEDGVAPRFWDARPYTRVVAWGQDYKGLRNYLDLNRLELIGMDRLSARLMVARVAELRRSCRLVPLGFEAPQAPVGLI